LGVRKKKVSANWVEMVIGINKEKALKGGATKVLSMKGKGRKSIKENSLLNGPPTRVGGDNLLGHRYLAGKRS